MALAGEVLGAPALPAPVRVQALGCLALAQQVNGQGAAAAETAERLLAAADAPGIPAGLRMDAGLQATSVLLPNGQQERALALMERILDESRRRGEAATTLNALLSIAGTRAAQLDDPAGALPYFEQAIVLSERARPGPPRIQDAILHYNHAYALLRLGRHAEAEAGFGHALRIARGLPEQQGFVDRATSHRGEIRRARGDRDGARELLETARAAQESSGDAHGLSVTLVRLDRLHLDESAPGAALAPARRALALAEGGGYHPETRDALELLASIHAALGEPAQAAAHTRRIQAMERERDRTAALDRLAQLQAQAERETAPGNATSQDVHRARLLRDLSLAGLVLVLAVGGTVLWRMDRRARTLRALGSIDPSTGLPNRREAAAWIDAMVAAHPGSDDRRCVLLLVGADGLASVEDRHGHETGERLLAHLAAVLRAACDPGDLVARWDGEAFLVGRADSSREAAFALAEHLRGAVARHPLVLADGTLLDPSVSIGLAAHPFFPDHAQARAGGWREGLRLADRALSTAKHAGGDAWAALRGLPGGRDGDLDSIRRNPEEARNRGWIAIGGNRPMPWACGSGTAEGPRQRDAPGALDAHPDGQAC